MTPAELKAFRLSHAPPGPRKGRRGRTHDGLSQSELATYLGVTPACVRNWEQGRRPVPSWVPIAIGWLANDLRKI